LLRQLLLVAAGEEVAAAELMEPTEAILFLAPSHQMVVVVGEALVAT
jgi:hypothetical protein